ncbi:MAG: branched-chain amino acid ABC transporter permease [Alphaproteobacteria bacterium]|nr:branched-chain amino acid ABC transporter permease [Alphaproteobacteria bacterium]TAD87990.1 MAG: branched-chain amino acid ABC transporter permease [Alphaproteobacteria bacterium]
MTGGATRAIGWLLLASALAIPQLSDSSAWLTFWITTLLFAFLGQAWNVLAGYGGQFSFGHAVFFGTAAYASAILQVRYGVNAWPAAVAGIAAGGAVGAFLGAVSFRYGLRGSYFALVTLAFAEVFRILANSLPFTGGGQGILIPLMPGASNLQFLDRTSVYYLLVGLVVVGVAISRWLEASRFGAWLVAVRENEAAASALGIRVFRVKLAAITLSGAMAGAAGVIYAQMFLYLDAAIAYGPHVSVEALLGPIIGGLGTVFGPIVGAVLLHALGEAAKSAMGATPGLNLVLYGIVLVVILRFLPDGVVGLLKRWGGR